MARAEGRLAPCVQWKGAAGSVVVGSMLTGVQQHTQCLSAAGKQQAAGSCAAAAPHHKAICAACGLLKELV
jgi:hypothetical protein